MELVDSLGRWKRPCPRSLAALLQSSALARSLARTAEKRVVGNAADPVAETQRRSATLFAGLLKQHPDRKVCLRCVGLSTLFARRETQAPAHCVVGVPHAARKKCANCNVRDFGWESAHEAVSRRPPIPLSTIVARTHMYTYAAKVWALSIVQGHSTANPSRFATSASLYLSIVRGGDCARSLCSE